jgi:hypothetical protein
MGFFRRKLVSKKTMLCSALLGIFSGQKKLVSKKTLRDLPLCTFARTIQPRLPHMIFRTCPFPLSYVIRRRDMTTLWPEIMTEAENEDSCLRFLRGTQEPAFTQMDKAFL